MKPIILSEEKLNELAQDASKRLLGKQFFDKGIIQGEDLKAFAKHEQINKFLLFQVYQAWNMQISKLKHPYFDFSNSEVQESLNVLRNRLSQNIRIAEKDFEPMLKRAIFNNLKLLLDPASTFESFFFANREEAPLEVFEKYTPFFSDLDFVVNTILRYHQKHGLEKVEKNTFMQKMEKVFHLYDQKSETDFDTYRSGIIQKLTGKTLTDIIVEAEREARLRKQEAAAREREREESIRKREEEDRKKRQMELLQKEEAERKRLEEERLQRIRMEEEVARKKEEEALKHNFFDTLTASDTNFFDIEEEITFPKTSEPKVAPVVQEVIPPKPPPVIEPPRFEEPAPIIPSPPVEIIPPRVEVPPKKVEVPPVPVEPELPPVPQAEVETTPKTIGDAISAFIREKEPPQESILEAMEREKPTVEPPKSVIDHVAEWNQTVETPPVPPVQETPPPPIEPEPFKTIFDEVKPSVTEGKESTQSFLNRFLKDKKEANGIVETPANGAAEEIHTNGITDEVHYSNGESNGETVVPVIPPVAEVPEDRPMTIAEKFQMQNKVEQQSQVETPLTSGEGKEIELNDIPIHKQYQFVQKVFEGNNVRFRIIVDKINNAGDKQEVDDILNKFVLNNDNIDRQDESVIEFLALMRSRF